jgi:hypothetical protein
VVPHSSEQPVSAARIGDVLGQGVAPHEPLVKVLMAGFEHLVSNLDEGESNVIKVVLEVVKKNMHLWCCRDLRLSLQLVPQGPELVHDLRVVMSQLLVVAHVMDILQGEEEHFKYFQVFRYLKVPDLLRIERNWLPWDEILKNIKRLGY